MEEDIKGRGKKHILASEKRIERRLETAVQAAEGRIAYENAHNEKLLLALDTIRLFLKEKKRVCYGGTAMNAILPRNLQFYNPEIDLPDYDFFTPDIEADIDIIVKKLRDAGFDDVYHKVGIHEGTKKILVNFTPVADITAISHNIYNVFLKRAYVRNGIHYTDPDILRMMMYLEISRPKGMVSRWEKVFDRLQLINKMFPPAVPRGRTTRKARMTSIPAPVSNQLFDYCIENQRTIISGPLDEFYSRVIYGQPHMNLIEHHRGVVGFLSPSAKEDALVLQRELGGHPTVQTFLHETKDEVVPNYVVLRQKGLPVAIIIEEVACHALLNFPAKDGRNIAIASLDTLITMYYTFSIFTNTAKTFFPQINQKIAKFVQLSERNRGLVNPHIPSFPLSCKGYQKGYSTLLREKFHRIQREKRALSKKAYETEE